VSKKRLAAEEGFAHVLAAHPQVRLEFLQHPGAHARNLQWMAREFEQPGKRIGTSKISGCLIDLK
jgi:hypothetical protein